MTKALAVSRCLAAGAVADFDRVGSTKRASADEDLDVIAVVEAAAHVDLPLDDERAERRNSANEKCSDTPHRETAGSGWPRSFG